MKPLHSRDMADATRLTRSGRLSEAVALIQSVLRGRRPNEWPQTDTAASIARAGGAARIARVLTRRRPRHARRSNAGAERAGGRPRPPRCTPLPGLRGLHGRRIAPADIAPAAGQFITGAFTSEAGTRAYKLYVPHATAGAKRRAPAHRHAARLHAIGRRFRRRHAHEFRRRGARLPRRLSRAARGGQCAAVLELVQAQRPAARRAASPR